MDPAGTARGGDGGGDGGSESGRETAAHAVLAIGCVLLVLGFFALPWLVVNALISMDNPAAAQPFETAIEALFAVGVGFFLFGCLLWASSRVSSR